MNCDQLDYFRRVAHLQHISRAAEELGMTQPALSRAIARLEREIGIELFHRAGRSITLTRFGTVFLGRVERALDELDEGRREIADMAGAEGGIVELGFLRTLGARYVPERLRVFRERSPGVKFSLIQNNGVALEELLVRGKIALCLVAGPPANPALEWRRIATQRFSLIVPPHHRLARRRSVPLREIAAESFISFKPGHAVREFTDQLCRSAGFVPSIAFEADESSSIRGFVASGFGVAIVPEMGTGESLPTLTLKEAHAQREIGVAWLHDRYLSSAERLFREFLTDGT